MKKIFYLFLCLFLVVGFTACEEVNLSVDGTSGDTTPPKVDDSSNNEENNSSSDERVTTPEPGQNSKVPRNTAVSMGMPSGVYWAECNLGAEKPEDAGWHLAWGETTPNPKGEYYPDSYIYFNFYTSRGTINSLTKYVTHSDHGTPDGKTRLEACDDAATVAYGAGWRLPTKDEVEELIANSTWELVTRNDIVGWNVTGKNGKTIFFPLAGNNASEEVVNKNKIGYYWTCDNNPDYSSRAYHLRLFSDSYECAADMRHQAMSVRPVYAK